jgi:hypothetical protein
MTFAGLDCEFLLNAKAISTPTILQAGYAGTAAG